MSEVNSTRWASRPIALPRCNHFTKLSLSRSGSMSSTRPLVWSISTRTNFRCFFLREFIDARMSDGLELRRRLFGDPFGVGVVPTGQGGRGDAEEVGGILDVGEADESSRLLQEPFCVLSTQCL